MEYTKEQLISIYQARGTFFVLFAKELKDCFINDEYEQKKIDSIVRACTKYCNYLQEKLDELEKQD